jgi:hypothetical protein
MLHGDMSVQSLIHEYCVNESTICTMKVGIKETICRFIQCALGDPKPHDGQGFNVLDLYLYLSLFSNTYFLSSFCSTV